MVSIKNQGGKCSATVDAEMTIYQIEEIKEKILPVIFEKGELEIDLSEICEIDSSGVQLLMLIAKERSAKGLPVIFTGHGKPTLDVLELMGLESYFKEPILASGETG